MSTRKSLRCGGARVGLALALSLLVVPSVQARAEAGDPVTGALYRVTAEPCLRIRAKPDATSRVLRCYDKGSMVLIEEQREGFAKIRLSDNREGWLSLSFVTPVTTDAGTEAILERVLTLEDDLAAATTAGEERDRRLKAAREALQDSQSANLRLEKQLAEARQKEEQSRNLSARLAALEAELAVSRDEVEGLRSANEKLETELAEARGQVNDLTARSTAAEQELEGLKLARDQAEATGSETAARIEALQEELAASRRELKSLQSADLERRQDEETTSDRVAELERQIEAALQEKERMRVQLQELEADFSRQLSQAGEDVARLEAEKRELLGRLGGSTAASERPVSEPAAVELATVAEPMAQTEPPSGSPQRVRPLEPLAWEDEEPVEKVRPLEPLAAEQADAEEPSPEDSVEAALDAVVAWAAAWSEQRVADYLAAYADEFQPPEGMSRGDWEELRRSRLLAPSTIAIDIDSPATTVVGPGRIDVVFTQSYRSDTYQDRVIKRLELERESGAWKILGESVEAQIE